MKLSDWLSIVALLITLTVAGFSAWSTLESRVSALEKGQQRGMEHMQDVQGIAREQIIDVLKIVHQLKGQHKGHLESMHKTEEPETQ